MEKTLEWFRGLGLFTVAEESGRVYPYSDQAGSVLDVLRFALEQPNIRVLLGTEVEKVRKTQAGFRLEYGGESLDCQRLIVACGGLAGTKLGGGMSGYRLLRSLGHHCTRLSPALVQLKTSWGGVVGLKGVRCHCRAEILRDGSHLRESTGELQLTEYGLSGPVILKSPAPPARGRATGAAGWTFCRKSGRIPCSGSCAAVKRRGWPPQSCSPASSTTGWAGC